MSMYIWETRKSCGSSRIILHNPHPVPSPKGTIWWWYKAKWRENRIMPSYVVCRTHTYLDGVVKWRSTPHYWICPIKPLNDIKRSPVWGFLRSIFCSVILSRIVLMLLEIRMLFRNFLISANFGICKINTNKLFFSLSACPVTMSSSSSGAADSKIVFQRFILQMFIPEIGKPLPIIRPKIYTETCRPLLGFLGLICAKERGWKG